MSTVEQQVADLESKVETLTKQLADQSAELVTKNATIETMKTEAVAKAEDEVLKVGDTEVRKSIVGAAQFSIFKAQEARIQKAEDDRELTVLTKRAEDEFGTLPGEPVAKAKVLKAVAAMPEEDRTALDIMLKAGEAALRDMTKSRGVDGTGNVAATADGRLDDAVAKFQTDNKIVNKHAAMNDFLKTDAGKKLYAEVESEKRRVA